MIDITIPVRVISEANTREHWGLKASRAKKQKNEAILAVKVCTEYRSLKLPLAISFVRYGKRKLDSDNLQGAFKAVRDGVAEALSINDGSDLITWDYKQEAGKDYAIRIIVKQL
jgi:hypothetical protein